MPLHFKGLTSSKLANHGFVTGSHCEVSKYNYIIVHPEASLICHTHQHYRRQRLPNTEWWNSRRSAVWAQRNAV